MGNDNNIKIGQRIHNSRKQKKLSMKELGKMVGLHESTISRYEKGEIMSLDIEKMKDFAKALDTTPAYLMGWDQEMNDDFGTELKELRSKKNVTIMEMAEEIHIDVNTLVQYENGTRKVPLEVLKKIADYFNVDVNNLVHSEIDDKTGTTLISTDKHKVERYNRFVDEVDFGVFSDEEFEKLLSYAKFIVSQRKDNKK